MQKVRGEKMESVMCWLMQGLNVPSLSSSAMLAVSSQPKVMFFSVHYVVYHAYLLKDPLETLFMT